MNANDILNALSNNKEVMGCSRPSEQVDGDEPRRELTLFGPDTLITALEELLFNYGTSGECCDVCGVFVRGYEHEFCCHGYECGCMGLPLHPCTCSQKCADNWNPPLAKESSPTETGDIPF
jgi:hypothetical protein